MKWSFMLVLVLSWSCEDPKVEVQPVVLTVSASHGLEPFPSWQGSSAYAIDLVYADAKEHVDARRIDDHSFAITPKVGTSNTLAFLCPRLSAPYMRRAPTLRDGACVVEFERDVPAATALDKLLLDIGPYEVAWYGIVDEPPPEGLCAEPRDERRPVDVRVDQPIERIVLCKRGDVAIDEIHLVAMPVDEEWQSFLAGQIDVIPQTPSMYRDVFERMRSVRLVSLASDSPVVLLFNTKGEMWSSIETRRALARSLDLDAIAKVACKDKNCRSLEHFRIETEQVTSAASGTTLPESLVVLIYDGHEPSLQAARVIRYQLKERWDIDVKIHRAPIAEYRQRLVSVAYDLSIAFVPQMTSDHSSLSQRLEKISGYENERFDSALNHRAYERGARILRDDLPMIPLFNNLSFAVIDEHFCDGEPRDMRSWLWLAEMVPCRGGDAP